LLAELLAAGTYRPTAYRIEIYTFLVRLVSYTKGAE
jgi:hypothetical protein